MLRVHPAVMRKMRAMAIKQALSELEDEVTSERIQYVAKRHGLGYPELKKAYKAKQREGE